MQILITGVGDAFTRLHFGSSAVVRAPEGWVLIDCPDLPHRAVHEAAAKAGWPLAAVDIDDIIVTHLHGDHSNGLESLAFARMIRRSRGENRPKLRLHINRQSARRVWEKLAPAMDGASTGNMRSLDDYFEVHELDPQREAHIAGLTVRCRFTQHPVPTTGLLLSDGNVTFGWSSDTPFEQAHIEWLAQADLIVHEANEGPAHTPIERLNELSAALRRKMHLIHLPDDFDRSCTDIDQLYEGQILQLRAAEPKE